MLPHRAFTEHHREVARHVLAGVAPTLSIERTETVCGPGTVSTPSSLDAAVSTTLGYEATQAGRSTMGSPAR